MKTACIVIGALAAFALHPAKAEESDAEKGVVVIGIKGDFAPDFTWRPFDPDTGKLLPFELPKNLTGETQKQLSGLFSSLGRLGGRDKRFDRNSAGLTYRMETLRPGTYVLETITTPKRWSAFQGPVPIVRIVAGQAAYVGDYFIESDKKAGGRASGAGYAIADVRTFLSAFPKVTSTLQDGGRGTAIIDCQGKLVAFSSQIVCDAERSSVSGVIWATP